MTELIVGTARVINSKMIDVKQIYDSLDWVTWSPFNEWFSEHPGIEFGVLRDKNLPKYPLDENIHEQKNLTKIRIIKAHYKSC